MENSKEVNESTFSAEVLDSKHPVLVDFWAPWCGPCKIMGPILEELSGEFEGKAVVGKLNVDENQSLAAQYQVQGIPTLILFNGGKEVNRIVGVVPKEEVQRILNEVIGS